MLAVVCVILKWLGMIVVCGLGVALLVLLCVLFVPVRYCLQGKAGEQKLLKARASWLFRILCVSFLVSDKGGSYKISVFGIPLPRGKAKKDTPPERKSSVSECGEETEEKAYQDADTVNQKDGSRHKAFQKKKRVARAGKSPKGFFLSIGNRLGKIKRKGGKVLEMLQDDNTFEFIALFKEKAGKLLHHLRPSQVKGWIHFGTSDPCTTGKILGGLSIVFAMWGKGLDVVPDFEKEVLEGEVDVRGRVRLVVFVVVMLQVLTNKKWQRWKRQWNAICN
jgi:hypothetical protein